jgi:DNA repair protein RadC
MSEIRNKYRVRDAEVRLVSDGPGSVSEVELLSMVVRPKRGTCANDLARDLLVAFGSLRTLCTADRESARKGGLDEGNYIRLHAALELTRRHYQQLANVGSQLSNPRATREFLQMRLRDLPHEVVCCLYLDNRHRVISFQELFRGTIDGSSIHPREVVKECLNRNAAAVILAHNHPSGVAEPSDADRLITTRLKTALSLVDVRLVDHLVVGDGVCESFAERGLL